MVKESLENTAAAHVFDRIFQENVDEHLKAPSTFIAKCRERFSEVIETCPPHSPSTPKEQVVRLRCMIQDELGPEYFPIGAKINGEGVESYHSGFLRDSWMTFEKTVEICGKTLARQRYVMVPVPGATEWWENEWMGSEELYSAARGPPSKRIEKFLAKFVVDEEFKPNTILELYGVFVDPVKDEEGIEEECHKETIPCFHVITHKQPEVDHQEPKEITIKKLNEALTTSLGDPNAANFLLMNLISTTYSRPAASLPICSFPLNLCGLENSKRIVEIITQLLPKVLHVKLTPELISETPFAPIKNYETETLRQGLLQVAPGTTVIFDETSLPEGNFQVTNYAPANCSTMEHVLLTQQIRYDFGYYQLPFDVDTPIIVISKGISRFIKTPWRVALPPGITGLPSTSDELIDFRQTIQTLKTKLKDISINMDEAKGVQEAFVELAKTLDPKKEDKSQTFHQMLILCRLISALHGKPSVDLESWREARKFEKERLETLNEWAKSVNLIV
ncbi:unnamed protein product, partial [Mesorhabditis belari]|uniref:Mini-chromosome maintenance complex-binding protein n=1 Tax=Mesorhabditis belari TaxID=2138241 RepID=A0AAF3EL97_9BILA